MSTGCWICLREAGDRYHSACLRALFGVSRAPRTDVRLAKLHTAALAMVGHTSLSGVQRKISVSLTADRVTLQVAIEGGRYILKPSSQTFPNLPENEHLTMTLAKLAGLEVPPCGLLPLADGSIAYVVSRFDRAGGAKLRQEDFCQLAEFSAKEKYQGSAELCARLVRRFASEPIIEALRLYRLFVFAWWSGNGDLHLKNLSLLTSEGFHRLSPCYDLVCTHLLIPDDPLALPVCGKKARLTREDWLNFAARCSVRPRAAQRVLRDVAGTTAEARSFIERSLLPVEMKASYSELIEERAASLAP